eukprot:scaffold155071_cov16-Tisochrysis_lutea.AAC.2
MPVFCVIRFPHKFRKGLWGRCLRSVGTPLQIHGGNFWYCAAMSSQLGQDKPLEVAILGRKMLLALPEMGDTKSSVLLVAAGDPVQRHG